MKTVKNIKAIVMDVDGVLTDGTFLWSEGGESKRFSFLDIMGISLGSKAGLLFALMSGEKSSLVDRFAVKMGIVEVYEDCKDKADALESFAQKNNISLSEICFIGDDVNDLPAMELAGFPAAPANAHKLVCARSLFVSQHKGGNGAVREIIDLIISKNINAK